MLTQDKTGLLQAFLGGLPGHVAARLARAVEVDRLMDGHALPHDDILHSLRPLLRRDGPARTPTPQRLFCQPFQDLLVSEPRKTKQKAVIARQSVTPLWNWVSQSLLVEETARYGDEIKTLALAHRLDDAMACAASFWPVAAAAIREGLDDPAVAKAALGDEMAVADAREAAQILSAGPEVLRLQAMLPKPVPSLNESLLWSVREVYDQLLPVQPDAVPFLAVILMNRLAKPCEALRLPMLVTRHTDDTLISQTDMGLVGEILFARMDALQTVIHNTRHPLFDAEALVQAVKSFTELSSAVVLEIELKRGGEWRQRLMKDRTEVGRVMEGFMERAPREVAHALPLQKSTGPKAADFSRDPGAEKKELALRYARLVTGSRNFAAAASFAAKQKEVYEETCLLLQRYNEDLVKELKSGNPERAGVAHAQFQFCTELSAILFSAEEAELLQRRGRAAQAAA